MFLCNLLLFNYQVITVLMNLIEMLISDCYHTHKKASLGLLPLDGAWLVYPERSDFYKKGFTFVKAFTEFQGHSLLHCSYIIKLKSLHKTLLLKFMLIWTLTQAFSLQYPYYNEKHGFSFPQWTENKNIKISIANIYSTLSSANVTWTLYI